MSWYLLYSDKYLGHKKCLIIMNSCAINCNILMKGIHFTFMQLSCVLPGVLCSNLVLVIGRNKGVTHQILSMLYLCILYSNQSTG